LDWRRKEAHDVDQISVLIIDDEEAVREGVRMVLEYDNMNVDEAGSGEEGLKRIEDNVYDVVLVDLRLPGIDGLEVLEQLALAEASPEAIMISAHADLSTAVEATRKGAFDFLEKPLDHDRLLVTVRNAGRHGRLSREARLHRETMPGVRNILGISKAINDLRSVIAKVAATDSRVLITGESGTGKELVARAIHAGSPRAREAFVEMNCASIPSELIESELFGHEKGAFTGASARRIGRFEQADRGTLFLDEVGDMSQAAQAKMLRVLEQGYFTRVGGAKSLGVDVRVIAATNKEVEKEVAEGRLREDLFYRLNVVRLSVPPLRERTEDVEVLAEHFLAHFTAKMGRSPLRLDKETRALLKRQPWPGNIRELKNVMERLALFCHGPQVGPDELLNVIDTSTNRGRELAAFQGTHPEFMEWAEQQFLQRRLQENGWNVTKTAQELGMQRSNLYKKIEKFDLKRPGKETSIDEDT
jgi:two-component system nitrogen regulation response regulator NtrX